MKRMTEELFNKYKLELIDQNLNFNLVYKEVLDYGYYYKDEEDILLHNADSLSILEDIIDNIPDRYLLKNIDINDNKIKLKILDSGLFDKDKILECIMTMSDYVGWYKMKDGSFIEVP